MKTFLQHQQQASGLLRLAEGGRRVDRHLHRPGGCQGADVEDDDDVDDDVDDDDDDKYAFE